MHRRHRSDRRQARDPLETTAVDQLLGDPVEHRHERVEWEERFGDVKHVVDMGTSVRQRLFEFRDLVGSQAMGPDLRIGDIGRSPSAWRSAADLVGGECHCHGVLLDQPVGPRWAPRTSRPGSSPVASPSV